MSGRVLVYGGKGALGSVVVNFFKSKNFVSAPQKYLQDIPLLQKFSAMPIAVHWKTCLIDFHLRELIRFF